MKRNLHPASWPLRYGAGVLITLICLGGAAHGSPYNFRVDVPLPQDVKITAVHAWEGYLWIGTDKGLYRCKTDGTSLEGPAVAPKDVFCLREEHGTYLLVGGYNGLFQVSRESLQLQRIAEPITAVQAVEEHKTGLWVGGKIGRMKNLYYVSDVLGHDHKNVFPNPSPVEVQCLLATSDGLWIGSDYGLYHLEKLGDKPENAPFDQKLDLVKAVFGNGEQLWYSSGYELDKGGLGKPAKVRRWDRGWNAPTTIGNDIGQVIGFADGRKELWLAGENGLIRMNKEGTCWENIDFSPGKEKVTSFHLDGDTLWLSTEKGLYRIDGQTREKWRTAVPIDSQPHGLHFTGESLSLQWRVADYGWRTAPWLLRPRAVSFFGNELPSNPVGDQKPERLTTSVGPLGSGVHVFRMEVSDLGGTTAHSEWVYAVVIPRWTFFILIGGGATGLILAHRWILRHLGIAEWRVEMVGCDYNIEVPAQLGQKTTLLFGTNKNPVEGTGWPPSNQEFKDLQKEVQGHTILIAAEASQFPFPWAAQIRGDIGYEANNTVAGQLWIGNPEGMTQSNGSSRSNLIGAITFAGLACLHSSYCNELEKPLVASIIWGRWINRVRERLRLRPPPNSLVDLVTEQFSLWGARIHPLGERAKTRATPEDFFRALREAEVVHVLAHGREAELVLDTVLTADYLEQVLARPGFKLRCRVLVLSACNAGSLQPGIGSFVLPLVKRGVHVVAASATVKYVGLITFFTKFYRTLFPSWRAQGRPLYEAFQRATAACLPPPGDRDLEKADLKGVNSIMLYGHPGFEFRFRLTFNWYTERFNYFRSVVNRQSIAPFAIAIWRAHGFEWRRSYLRR